MILVAGTFFWYFARAPAQLYDAASPGMTEANFLEVLRGCGEAEVKFRHGGGWTVLTHMAANHGAVAGLTVLMKMAMFHDWTEAAAALIERGCDVNEQKNDGLTALHIAGLFNHSETARVLLEHGADRTIKDKHGMTAADVARYQNHSDLAVYIDGALARPPRAARTSTFHPLSARGCQLRRRMGAYRGRRRRPGSAESSRPPRRHRPYSLRARPARQGTSRNPLVRRDGRQNAGRPRRGLR